MLVNYIFITSDGKLSDRSNLVCNPLEDRMEVILPNQCKSDIYHLLCYFT